MRRFISIIVLLLCAAVMVHAQIPPTLGWYQIPNSDINTQCLLLDPNQTQCYSIIATWSGSAMDTTRNQLLIWGGGHGGYGGNEVYSINLNTLVTQRLTANTAGCNSLYSCDGGLTPNARHTYDSIGYMPAPIDAFYAFSGAPIGNGFNQRDTWLLHMDRIGTPPCNTACSQNAWQFKDLAGNTASWPYNVCGSCTGNVAYDPAVPGTILMYDAFGLLRYDPTANKYTLLNTTSTTTADHMNLRYDYTHKRLYSIGFNFSNPWLIYFDGANNWATHVLADPAGTVGAPVPTPSGCDGLFGYNAPGFDYDPVSDRMVGWSGGNSVVIYNQATNSCTTVTYPNGPPVPTSQTGIFGHFRYSAASGVFIAVNAFDQNAYTLRLEGGTPDTTPPSTPTNLAASVISSTQINLTWTASTDNVAVGGYSVERCSGAGCSNFAQIATPAGTSANDTGLTGSTSYSYRIRAFDNSSNFSGYSSTVTATTAAPDSVPPTAPTGLTATAVSSSQINLSWTASTDNVAVTGYKVESCSGVSCSSFAQIGAPVGVTYSDFTVAASTSYSYRVRATDAAGNLSPYSSTASATTPAAPSTITLVDFGATSGADTFGLTGWSTQINDVYTGNVATGPGGMTITNGNNQGYNYQGVTTATNPRNFVQGEIITVTWYNADVSPITFTPNISFNWNGRIVNGGTWYPMSAVTIGATASGTTSYTVDGTSTGTYSIVDINNNFANSATLIADKIVLQPSGSSDTTAPSTPASLVATPISNSEIDLSWTASTDNVGVTGYLIERCLGTSCTNFTQITTTVTNSYKDLGLGGLSHYIYRIRATDAAGNLSSYSSTASADTPAPVTGVIQVGPTRTYTTINAGLAVAGDGATLQIDSGIYPEVVNNLTLNNVTLMGVGGTAHMKWGDGNYMDCIATSNFIPNDKAILIISGNNDTIDHMEFSGACVADQNGAGIRIQGGNVTITNSSFHDNEDGVLGGVSNTQTMDLERNIFQRNGYCPSNCDHNVYITAGGTLIFKFNLSTDSNDGHALKSRAQVNFVEYNFLSTKNSIGSFESDFPNGGVVYYIGNVIEQGNNSNNSGIVAFGEEGSTNPNPAMYIINNTFYNYRAGGCTFIEVSGAQPILQIQNNIFATVGGTSTILTGASADTSKNIAAVSPAYFSNIAQGFYDLLPGVAPINAGTDPGMVGTVNLTPIFQYVLNANSAPRSVNGPLDDGAYEFSVVVVPGVFTATTSITQSSLTLNWTKGSGISPQNTLQYTVYKSSANNIDTVANMLANGTVAVALTTDISTANISGLNCGTTTFFNIIIQDQGGNRSAYNGTSAVTLGCLNHAGRGRLRK